MLPTPILIFILASNVWTTFNGLVAVSVNINALPLSFRMRLESTLKIDINSFGQKGG